MASDAGRNIPRLIATAVQIGTGLPKRRIRLETRYGLRLVIHGEIADVLIAEGAGKWLHDRVVTRTRTEHPQLLGDVHRALTREARPVGIGTVAVGAVAGRAHRGL